MLLLLLLLLLLLQLLLLLLQVRDGLPAERTAHSGRCAGSEGDEECQLLTREEPLTESSDRIYITDII